MTKLYVFYPNVEKPKVVTIDGWIEVEGTKVYECSCEEGFPQPDLTNHPETIQRKVIIDFLLGMNCWMYKNSIITKFQFVNVMWPARDTGSGNGFMPIDDSD